MSDAAERIAAKLWPRMKKPAPERTPVRSGRPETDNDRAIRRMWPSMARQQRTQRNG